MNILVALDGLAGKWLNWRLDQESKHNPVFKEFKLKKLEMHGSTFNMVLEHPVVAIMADECAQFLTENQAQNYVTFDMMPRIDRGLKPIRVTVQWASGVSPAEKASRLEQLLIDLVEGVLTSPYQYPGARPEALTKACNFLEEHKPLTGMETNP